MPPVPVHIDDPITPQKAQPAPSNASHTPTSTAAFPAAQPGAATFPVSTPAATYLPQPTQPTRTTQPSRDASPPPPQPGAVPVPQSHQVPMTAASPIPPPPKAGMAAVQNQASTITTPPQMSMPAPLQNYAPVHGTSPAVPAPTGHAPVSLNFGAAPAPAPAPSNHPPGYKQDTNAQEMSSAARRSLEGAERRESLAQGLGFGGSTGGGGIGGDGTNETLGSAWNAVKGWANKAGETLIETDKKFWDTVNKKS